MNCFIHFLSYIEFDDNCLPIQLDIIHLKTRDEGANFLHVNKLSKTLLKNVTML